MSALKRLEKEYDLLGEKIHRLRMALIIETAEAVRFQLEKQIEEAEAEQKRIEQQLEGEEKLTLTCPYRGLFAFREQDEQLFFGREAYTEKLVEVVQTKPFVAVIGASGSGKSSVVYAGLIPELGRQGNWLITSFRPGEHPFRGLSSALVPFLEPDLDEIDRIKKIKKLTQNLIEGELNLADILEAISQKNSDFHLLLFADQFEELYTLCREEDERRRFLDELLGVVGVQTSVCCILTMRADFLGKALTYRLFADVLQDGDIKLGPMNQEELRATIEEPAGKLYVEIEEGLTDRILQAVTDKPGSLPLLEFGLTELWKKQAQIPSDSTLEKGRVSGMLTHAAYDKIGGVEKALASYAESVYNSFDSEGQQRLRIIFTKLVRPGEGTEDTSRIATSAEIGEENWELVTKIADTRLVVTSTASLSLAEETQTGIFAVYPEKSFEMVHEALIREWKRLRDWLETDREFLTWQERLRTARRQWKASREDEGALLRGVMLAEAENWFEQRQEDLSPKEQDFIEKSRKLRDREAKARKKRLWGIIIGLVVGLLIAVVLAVVAGIQWRQADKQRQSADKQREIAQAQRANSELQTEIFKNILLKYDANPISVFSQTAKALLVSHDDLGAVFAGVKAGKHTQQANVPEPLKRQVMAILSEVLHSAHEKNRLEGHKAVVESLVFSPDGALLASGSEDKTIKLWNVTEGREIRTLKGHSGRVESVTFSPDSTLLASGSWDKTIKLWNVADGTEIRTLHSGWVESVIFSPDGTLLASVGGNPDNSIKLWNVTDGTEIRTLQGHSAGIFSVTFSPDGTLLASGSGDKTIKLWNVAKGKKIKTLYGHSGRVESVAFSPDGTLLASGGGYADKTIKLWNVADGTELRTIHSGWVESVIFSPDGTLLASVGGYADNSIKLWNVADGTELRTLQGHSGGVESVIFSPDGTLLASGGWDRTIKLWDVSDSQTSIILPEHLKHVLSVTFSPNGALLASGGWDKIVKLWNVTDGTEIRALRGHSGPVKTVTFSPDGTLLASVGINEDHTIKLWNVADGRKIMTLYGHSGGVPSVTFSPDSTLLASGSWDATVKLWNVADGREIRTLHGHSTSLQSITFSPDGTLLASGSNDATIKLWNVSDGREIRTLYGHSDTILSVDFSPDGTLLVSGSEDREIKLWNVANGKEIKTLYGHSGGVESVTFSPDGTLLASGSWDKTVKLWNVAGGKEITTLYGHSGTVQSVDFSPDGRLLASGSSDKTIIRDITYLYNLDLDDLLRCGCTWLHGYLKNNPNVSEEDRALCDDILRSSLPPSKEE